MSFNDGFSVCRQNECPSMCSYISKEKTFLLKRYVITWPNECLKPKLSKWDESGGQLDQSKKLYELS